MIETNHQLLQEATGGDQKLVLELAMEVLSSADDYIGDRLAALDMADLSPEDYEEERRRLANERANLHARMDRIPEINDPQD